MKTKVIYAFHILLVVAAAWGVGFSVAKGQEGTLPAPQAPQALVSGFSYQGSLKQAGSAVNSTCDFKFGLVECAEPGDAAWRDPDVDQHGQRWVVQCEIERIEPVWCNAI